MLRPSDAAYTVAALLVVTAFAAAPLSRRVSAGAVLLVGVAVGASQWVIDAYTSFGGLSARISQAQAENGGGGLHFAGAAQARTLAGPLLCRHGCHPDAGIVFQLWWPAMLTLVVLAVAAAHRQQRLVAELAPIVVGLGLAALYIFTVTYAAPRFLLGTYGLLSLPCAAGVLHLTQAARRPRPRAAITAALTGVLLIHTATQFDALTRYIRPANQTVTTQLFANADRVRAAGLHHP